jgi:EAL domain-containing protein (putative c-di-GMP-specific phosphodiesterase class I)
MFLLIAIAVTAILCSIMLIAVIRRSLLRWIGGISEWAWACALMIAASLLFGDGETRSFGVVRLIANVTMFGAMLMMVISLRKLDGLASAFRVLASFVVVCSLMLFVLTYFQASYTARAACVLFAHTVLFFACAMTMFRMPNRKFPENFTGAIFAILVAISVVRFVAILAGYETSDILEAKSDYQRAYLLTFAACIFAAVIGYMLLVVMRLRQMLRRVMASGTFETTNDRERFDLERELRGAIDNGELLLHFQPRASIRTGDIVGVEALVRWNHPVHGTLLPALFVPLGEQTAVIHALGQWVLQQAADVMNRLHASGHRDINMSINVSARQIGNAELPRQIARLLEGAQFHAHQIELELTESSVVGDKDDASRVMAELKSMGVRLSVDDFGTGYSSLAYIKNWPIDCVKIDRSFVNDIPHNPGDVAITRAITALGHSLGLNVVAEGVERTEQLEFLRGLGCDEYQGFLVSKPIPENELIELLESRRAIVPDPGLSAASALAPA